MSVLPKGASLLGRAVAPALAVLLLGIGGAAAAGVAATSEPTDPPTTQAPTTEAPVDPTAPPTTDAPPTDEPTEAPTDEPTEAPTDEPTEVPTSPPATDDGSGVIACDQARNHGEYVSSVARNAPKGPERGAVVSEAAKSDCGKKPKGDSDDDATPGDTDDDADDGVEGKDKSDRDQRDKAKGKKAGKNRG
jgi:hypothetical protein